MEVDEGPASAEDNVKPGEEDEANAGEVVKAFKQELKTKNEASPGDGPGHNQGVNGESKKSVQPNGKGKSGKGKGKGKSSPRPQGAQKATPGAQSGRERR